MGLDARGMSTVDLNLTGSAEMLRPLRDASYPFARRKQSSARRCGSSLKIQATAALCMLLAWDDVTVHTIVAHCLYRV